MSLNTFTPVKGLLSKELYGVLPAATDTVPFNATVYSRANAYEPGDVVDRFGTFYRAKLSVSPFGAGLGFREAWEPIPNPQSIADNVPQGTPIISDNDYVIPNQAQPLPNTRTPTTFQPLNTTPDNVPEGTPITSGGMMTGDPSQIERTGGSVSQAIGTTLTQGAPPPTDTQGFQWDQGLLDRNSNYTLDDYNLGADFSMRLWFENYMDDPDTEQRFNDANQIWDDWQDAGAPRIEGQTPFGNEISSLQGRTQASLMTGKGIRQAANAAANWRDNEAGIERAQSDWTQHDVYYQDFINKLNEKGIPLSRELKESINLKDFPFDYDESQLYMKLPESKYSQLQKTHKGEITQDKVIDQTLYVDITGGDAPIGSYSLLKIEVPEAPEISFGQRILGLASAVASLSGMIPPQVLASVGLSSTQIEGAGIVGALSGFQTAFEPDPNGQSIEPVITILDSDGNPIITKAPDGKSVDVEDIVGQIDQGPGYEPPPMEEVNLEPPVLPEQTEETVDAGGGGGGTQATTGIPAENADGSPNTTDPTVTIQTPNGSITVPNSNYEQPSTSQTVDSDGDGVPDSQDAAPDNASVQYDWEVEEYEDPWNSDTEWDDDLYDSVFQRQVYQVAVQETDPVLKEAYIERYKEMGGNHLEDLLQGRPAEDIYGDYPEKPPAEQAPDTEYDRESFDQAFPDGAFGQGFDDLDANNDGIVDSSELLEAETNFENQDSSGTSLVEELTNTNNPFDVLTDSDGDGVIDTEDAFPNDPSEQVDTDGDGIGDNSDDLPNDPNNVPTLFDQDPFVGDRDKDGVLDRNDAFPDDPNEQVDSDNDGVGDNSDAAPNDPSRVGEVPELFNDGSMDGVTTSETTDASTDTTTSTTTDTTDTTDATDTTDTTDATDTTDSTDTTTDTSTTTTSTTASTDNGGGLLTGGDSSLNGGQGTDGQGADGQGASGTEDAGGEQGQGLGEGTDTGTGTGTGTGSGTGTGTGSGTGSGDGSGEGDGEGEGQGQQQGQQQGLFGQPLQTESLFGDYMSKSTIQDVVPTQMLPFVYTPRGLFTGLRR